MGALLPGGGGRGQKSAEKFVSTTSVLQDGGSLKNQEPCLSNCLQPRMKQCLGGIPQQDKWEATAPGGGLDCAHSQRPPPESYSYPQNNHQRPPLPPQAKCLQDSTTVWFPTVPHPAFIATAICLPYRVHGTTQDGTDTLIHSRGSAPICSRYLDRG